MPHSVVYTKWEGPAPPLLLVIGGNDHYCRSFGRNKSFARTLYIHYYSNQTPFVGIGKPTPLHFQCDVMRTPMVTLCEVFEKVFYCFPSRYERLGKVNRSVFVGGIGSGLNAMERKSLALQFRLYFTNRKKKRTFNTVIQTSCWLEKVVYKLYKVMIIYKIL